MARLSFAMPVVAALALLAGCKTANEAADTVKDAGSSVAHTAGDALGGAVSLVNVDLSNVLNDLSLDLKIDKANIPINAQIPISVAANVCGVSINILSIGGGGSPNCTANSTSPELEQAVQQQLAANGSVGGGSQSTSGASASGTTTATTTPTPAPTSTSGAASTTTPTPAGGQ